MIELGPGYEFRLRGGGGYHSGGTRTVLTAGEAIELFDGEVQARLRDIGFLSGPYVHEQMAKLFLEGRAVGPWEHLSYRHPEQR